MYQFSEDQEAITNVMSADDAANGQLNVWPPTGVFYMNFHFTYASHKHMSESMLSWHYQMSPPFVSRGSL